MKAPGFAGGWLLDDSVEWDRDGHFHRHGHGSWEYGRRGRWRHRIGTIPIGLTTTTTLSAGTNPSVFGQSVTFTATVSAGGTATGTVTFKDGSTTLGTGTLNGSAQATFTTSSLSVGGHSITAAYGGDGTFPASTSTALTQTVNSASTSTSLVSSANPSVFGQSVTFTATVSVTALGAGTPTGTVTFKDGSTTLGTGTLNASRQATLATSLLSVGSHSITAVYAGDTNFSTSTSIILTQVVSLTNYTAPSTTGTGNITASFTGGDAGCSFTAQQFIPLTGNPASPPAGSAPAGVTFPHGLFNFTVGGCTTLGGTLNFSITYPQPLLPGTQYWKYGPTLADPTPHWYVLPAVVAGNTVTFSITDGGLGDSDLTANRSIVDPGGVKPPTATGKL